MLYKFKLKRKSFAALLLMMASCAPSMNWREYRFEGDELTFLMPCKAVEESKEVPIALEKQVLTMAVCNVGDVNFTISRLARQKNISDETLIALWQKASLFALTGSDHVQESDESTKKIKIQNKEILAHGLTAREGIQAKWQWFQQGQWVYQLGIYSRKKQEKNKADQEVQNMFFESIR